MTSATDPLLTEKEVSAWIGVSTPNLQRMRSNGTGPRYVQLSPRRIGYRKSDVETWLTSRTTDRIGALAPAAGAGMSDESLSLIASNFENVPTNLQGISHEKVCPSPASDGGRESLVRARRPKHSS